jgi:hypothetical protein
MTKTFNIAGSHRQPWAAGPDAVGISIGGFLVLNFEFG